MPSESVKSSRNRWKARQARRAKNKKKQENDKQQPLKGDETKGETSKPIPKESNKENNEGGSSKKGIGGSVMVENHMETLDALLQAYKARLKPLETLEERWRQYPNPELETRRLEMYKRLIETT